MQRNLRGGRLAALQKSYIQATYFRTSVEQREEPGYCAQEVEPETALKKNFKTRELASWFNAEQHTANWRENGALYAYGNPTCLEKYVTAA